METLVNDYKKYRWFYTSSGKLVVGGKSAAQNDSLLKQIKSSKKELIIMHTSSPGSPFSVILHSSDDLKKSDLEECAVFTGCFSQAWKSGKAKTNVDIFLSSNVFKLSSMKEGTWGVREKLDTLSVELKLVLTRQNGMLRAVPESSVKSKKDRLLYLCPGKIEKQSLLGKLALEIGEFNQEEILSALPSGGIKIFRK